jgi:imidazolonepropionase-like amidohydrolase
VHSGGTVKRRFLQVGVTTVRDLATVPEEILAAREDERRGLLSGPRIVAAGPLIDGDPPAWGTDWRGSVAVSSAEQAREVAHELIDLGVDWLKVHRGLTPEMVAAIVEAGREHGVPVAGHLMDGSAREAVALGVRSIEHASGIRFQSLTADERRDLIDLFIERGAFVVPTLVVTERNSNLPAIGNADFPGLDLVTERQRRRWLDWRHDRRFRAADFGAMQRQQAAKRQFVGDLYRAGGRIVAGSDTSNPFVIPGLSLHDELALLVSAGLTPLDAIRSATSVAAEMLGRSDLGAVEVGRLADLLVVAGNPLEDIQSTRNVRMVVKGGRVVHEQEAAAVDRGALHTSA